MATERKDDHLDRRIPESKEEGSFDRDLHRTLNLTIGQINDLEEKVESFGGPGGGGAAPERVEQLENRVEEFESGVESALSSFEKELGELELEARDEVFTQPVELRAESTEVIGSDGAGRHTVEFEPEELQFRSRPGGSAPLSIRPRRIDLPEKARFEGGGDNRYADVWASGNGNLQIAPKRPDEAVQGPAPADVEVEAREILPKESYETSLGSEQRKFLSMHVAELWVESLVAQKKIATIGGNVFVGPTTELTKALSGDPSDADSHPSRDYYNYVRVKHNQMSPGDVVMLDNFTRVEFLRVESEPVQIEAENEEEGGEDNPFDFVRDYNYRYRVERDLDGSGANDWKKGAAVANTGRKKSGFIDLYAERSRRAENESGPSMAISVREEDKSTYGEGKWAPGTEYEDGDVVYWDAADWDESSTYGSGDIVYYEPRDQYYVAQTSTSDGPPSNSDDWMSKQLPADTNFAAQTSHTAAEADLPLSESSKWSEVEVTDYFNQWSERSAIGNLDGLYDFTDDVYGVAGGKYESSWFSVDENQGFRLMNAGTKVGQWDTDGTVRVGPYQDSYGAHPLTIQPDGTLTTYGEIRIPDEDGGYQRPANWQGDWATGVSYEKGDVVYYNGVSYICNTTHTSSTSDGNNDTAEPNDSGYWDTFTESQTMRIAGGSRVFTKRKDGTVEPDPDSDGTGEITLTAKYTNITSPSFTWEDGSGTQIGTGSSITIDHTQLSNDTLDIVLKESNSGLQDSTRLALVEEGTDAITVIVSNPSHTFPAKADGTVEDYGNADATVEVYEGATKLDYDGSLASASTFDVAYSASDVDGDGNDDITGTTSTGTQDWTFDPGSMQKSAGRAVVTLDVTAKRSDSSTETHTRKLIYTKANKAQTVRLTASSQVIRLNKDGTTDNDPISFTLSKQNILDSTTWSTSNSVTLSSTTDTSAELQYSDLTGAGVRQTTVTAEAGGYSDEMTVAVVEEGTDTLTTILSNSNHTYPADENGNITVQLSNGSCGVGAYEGATQLTVDQDLGNAETFDVSIASETGITGSFSLTDGNATATYTPSSVGSAQATVKLDITIKRADGTTETITRTLTYSKAVAGVDSRVVVVEAPSQVFQRGKDGTYSPGSIQLSAGAENISNPSFSWTSSNTSYSDSGSTTTISPSDLDSDGRISLTVEETGSGRTDSITLVEVKAGSDSLSGFLTNPAHTFPTSAEGVVQDYTGSGTAARMYEGATQLGYTDNLLKADAGNEHGFTGGYFYTDDYNSTESALSEFGLSTGDTVSVAMDMKTDGTSGAQGTIRMRFYDSTGTKVAGHQGDTTTTGTTSYERLYLEGITIPTDAARIEIQADDEPNDGSTYYARRAILTTGATALPASSYTAFHIISDNNGDGTGDIGATISGSSTEWQFTPTSMQTAADTAQVEVELFGKRSDGSTGVLERQVNYSKSLAGGAPRIKAGGFVYKKNKDGTFDPSSITLQGRAPNVDSPSFDWDIDEDGTAEKTGTSSVSISESQLDSTTRTLEVTMTETKTGQTDSVTLAEVVEGTDSVTTVLSNENHTYTATADGAISTPSTGDSDITAYEGNTKLSVDTGGAASSFNVTVDSSSGVNVGTLDKSTYAKKIVYQPPSGPMTADEGSVTLKITATRSDGSTAIQYKTISYTVSRAVNSTRILPSGLTLTRKKDGTYVPDPDSDGTAEVQLTGKAPNVDSPSFDWDTTEDGTYDTTALTSIDITPSDLTADGTLEVTMKETTTGVTDTVTITEVVEGSDALTPILSNENHTYDASFDGSVSDYSTGSSDVIAYEGATQLSTGTGAGTFDVTVASETNVSGSLSESGNVATYTPSGMSAEEGSVTLDITIRPADSGKSAQTFTRKISYSKAVDNQDFGYLEENASDFDGTYSGLAQSNQYMGYIVDDNSGNRTGEDRWRAYIDNSGNFYLNDASDASALEYVADFNQSKGMFAVGDTEEAKTYFGSSGYGPENESYPTDPNSFFGYHRGVVALNGQVGGLIGEDGLEMKDSKGETAVRIDNDYVYEVQPSGTGGSNDFSDPISSDDSDQSRSTGHTLEPGANNVTLTVSGNAGEIGIDIRDKTYTYSVPSAVRFELYAKSSGTVLKDSVATILDSSSTTENIDFSVDAVSGGTDYSGEELMVRATAFYEGEGGSITIDKANVNAYLPATEINSRGVKVALGGGEEVRMGAGGFKSTIGMESTVYSFPKGGRIIDEGSGLFYVTGTTSRRLDAEKVAGSVEEADKLDGNEGAYYLDASNINAGTLGTSYVPNLSASKITSGTLGTGRIPTISASKLSDVSPDSTSDAHHAKYTDSDAVSAIESTRINSLRLENQEFDSSADESKGVVVFDKSAGMAYYNDAGDAPGNNTGWHRILDTGVLNVGSELTLSRNGKEGQVGLSIDQGAGSGLNADKLDGYEASDLDNSGEIEGLRINLASLAAEVQTHNAALQIVVPEARELIAGNAIGPLGDLSEDRTVMVQEEDLAGTFLASDGSGALAVQTTGDLVGDGGGKMQIGQSVVQTREIDDSIAPTWTGLHTHSADIEMQSQQVRFDDGVLQGDGAGALEVLKADESNQGTLRVDEIVAHTVTVVDEIDQRNVNDLRVEDQYIVVNENQSGTPGLDGGLVAERGGLEDAYIEWEEGLDVWGTRLENGTLKPLTLRDTSMTPAGIPYWNQQEERIETDSDLKFLADQSQPFEEDPAGKIQTKAGIGHPDYTAEKSHWYITPGGLGDFRTLLADELRVEAFIAEVEEALAGEDFLTKSFAKLDEGWTVPQSGSSADITLQNLPGLAGSAVFQEGDTVRLRYVNRSGGGLTVADVWAEVTKPTGFDATGETQTWSATVLDAGGVAGETIEAGSVALDYGVPGDFLIERSVLNPSGGDIAPYDRMLKWKDNDGDGIPDDYEVLNLRGRLDGLNKAYASGFGTYTETARITSDIIVGDLEAGAAGNQTGSYLRFSDNTGLEVVYGDGFDGTGDGRLSSAVLQLEDDVRLLAQEIVQEQESRAGLEITASETEARVQAQAEIIGDDFSSDATISAFADETKSRFESSVQYTKDGEVEGEAKINLEAGPNGSSAVLAAEDVRISGNTTFFGGSGIPGGVLEDDYTEKGTENVTIRGSGEPNSTTTRGFDSDGDGTNDDPIDGDFYIDTSDGDKPYVYDGPKDKWFAAYTNINGGNITTGTVNLDRLSFANAEKGHIDAQYLNITASDLTINSNTTFFGSEYPNASGIPGDALQGDYTDKGTESVILTGSGDPTTAAADPKRSDGTIQNGDMYLDTSDGEKPYIYNGEWRAAYTQINGGNITTGQITLDRMAFGEDGEIAAQYLGITVDNLDIDANDVTISGSSKNDAQEAILQLEDDVRLLAENLTQEKESRASLELTASKTESRFEADVTFAGNESSISLVANDNTSEARIAGDSIILDGEVDIQGDAFVDDLFARNLEINSGGEITSEGEGFKINADGSGQLAGGDINWGSSGGSATFGGTLAAESGDIGGWEISSDSISSPPTNSTNEMKLLGSEGQIEIKDPSNTGNVLRIGNIGFDESIAASVDGWYTPSESSSCDVETDRCVDTQFDNCDPPPYNDAVCYDPGPNSYNIDRATYYDAKPNVTYRISYDLTKSTTTNSSDVGYADASAEAKMKIKLRDGNDNVITSKTRKAKDGSNNSNSGTVEISTSDSSVDEVQVVVKTQTSASASDSEEGYFASSASSDANASTGELQELGGTNEFISSKGLAYNPGQTEAKQVGIKRQGDFPAVGGAILVGEWEIVQDSNGNLVAEHGPSNTEKTLATSS